MWSSPLLVLLLFAVVTVKPAIGATPAPAAAPKTTASPPVAAPTPGPTIATAAPSTARAPPAPVPTVAPAATTRAAPPPPPPPPATMAPPATTRPAPVPVPTPAPAPIITASPTAPPPPLPIAAAPTVPPPPPPPPQPITAAPTAPPPPPRPITAAPTVPPPPPPPPQPITAAPTAPPPPPRPITAAPTAPPPPPPPPPATTTTTHAPTTTKPLTLWEQLFGPTGWRRRVILKAFNGRFLTTWKSGCQRDETRSYCAPDFVYVNIGPPGEKEHWIIERINDNEVALQSSNGQYLRHWYRDRVNLADEADIWEFLTPVKNPNGSWSFKSRYGKWLSAVREYYVDFMPENTNAEQFFLYSCLEKKCVI